MVNVNWLFFFSKIIEVADTVSIFYCSTNGSKVILNNPALAP